MGLHMENLAFHGIDHLKTPDQIGEIFAEVRKDFRFSQKRNVRYFNVPVALDMRFCSFVNERTVVGALYAWCLSIYGVPILGRTYSELLELLNTIVNTLKLDDKKRLAVYVFDLYRPFQHFHKYFTFTNVFATSKRHPVTALTDSGIEFRCAELFSGVAKSEMHKYLAEYDIPYTEMMIDENKKRNCKTPLTTDEKRILVSDTQTVGAYVAERANQDGGIAKLPMSKTGYIREMCRNFCFYKDGIPIKGGMKRKKYKEFIDSMILDVEDYKQLKRACVGGFTNCNRFCVSEIIDGVTSYDIISSYIAVLCSEEFPMSSPKQVEIETDEQLEEYLHKYCCLMDVKFTNIMALELSEAPISVSRCWELGKHMADTGGKLLEASNCCTTITDVDWEVINAFYKYDSVEIANFRIYQKGYIPREIIGVILNLYKRKTALKGVEGKEGEYTHLKEMLNSVFGMTIQNPVTTKFPYNCEEKEWEEEVTDDIAEALDNYNKNPQRFMYYPWGVWTTAYARRNLLQVIYEAGEDYVYSDTDCIKIQNAHEHTEYINAYNEEQTGLLKYTVSRMGFPEESVVPKNKFGVEKPLGSFEVDERYRKFKSLGSKRYIFINQNGEYGLTVAGIDKKTALPYLVEQNGQLLLQNFNETVNIPPEFANRKIEIFCNTPYCGELTDYLGETAEYSEQSGIGVEYSGYSFKNENLTDFLAGAFD